MGHRQAVKKINSVLRSARRSRIQFSRLARRRFVVN